MSPDDEIFQDILGALKEEMSRIMRRCVVPGGPAFLQPSVWCPPTDVFETHPDIVVRMDIAGTQREDITINIENNVLSIRGVRREQPMFQKTAVSRMEIEYGPFEQRISLPREIDVTKVEAVYGNGFLTIRVPKSVRTSAQTVCVEIKG